MACLGRLRVTTLLTTQEAIRGSLYPRRPLPPSPAPPRPTRRRTGAALRRPPPGPAGRGGPPRRGRHLPPTPVLPAGHPVGLPLPGTRPRPVLPRRAGPLPRLARRTPPAA